MIWYTKDQASNLGVDLMRGYMLHLWTAIIWYIKEQATKEGIDLKRWYLANQITLKRGYLKLIDLRWFDTCHNEGSGYQVTKNISKNTKLNGRLLIQYSWYVNVRHIAHMSHWYKSFVEKWNFASVKSTLNWLQGLC
jgi:hypothetical protein